MIKTYEVVTEHTAEDLSKRMILLLAEEGVELVGGVSAVVVDSNGYKYISYSQAILK